MVPESVGGPAGDIALVMTTIGSAEAAEHLVHTLLEEGLVACGNIVPDIVSIYRWEGKITREREAVVLLKTAPARVKELSVRIEALHPYAVPEVATLPMTDVFPPYARWVLESTGMRHEGSQ